MKNPTKVESTVCLLTLYVTCKDSYETILLIVYQLMIQSILGYSFRLAMAGRFESIGTQKTAKIQYRQSVIKDNPQTAHQLIETISLAKDLHT
jgi:hypothetical protein